MVKCKLFTPKADIPAPFYVALSALTFVLLAAIWSALTYSDLIPPKFLPSPDKVVKDGVILFSEFDLMNIFGPVCSG